MSTALRLVLRRGDLSLATAGALVTSANDSLVGNLQPMYWRFISRRSVDGAVRERAGEALERACLQIEPTPRLAARQYRRDITRWTSGVKRGASECIRCPAGSAISTEASGQLQADHVIHAVAPDSEFGYEGLYTGGEVSQEASGLISQQFSPPDRLLLSAYQSALAEATRLGVSSVACPVSCNQALPSRLPRSPAHLSHYPAVPLH